MSKILENKIVLVTGSGRGIGKRIATLFAEKGATIILTSRTIAQLQEVDEEIKASGGNSLVIAGDINNETFVDTLFDTIKTKYGRLDILINNAGIYPAGSISEMSVSCFHKCIETNIVSVFNCSKHAVDIMRKTTGEGKIINIGSTRSHWVEKGDAGAYSSSKFGLRALTESMSRELHGIGSRITIGIICPGTVNLKEEDNSNELTPSQVAEFVLHTATAPAGINVFDTTLFAITQRSW